MHHQGRRLGGFMEDQLGTLEVGKLADLVVLSADPRSVSGEQMMQIPVELTIADGRLVFGDL